METGIEVRHISKKYPGGIVALEPTSVTLPPGKAIGVVGENGSGKSTFIKLLAGYLTPDDGTITVNGLSPLKHFRKFRKQLGYLSQDTQLDPEMTGYESMAMFASFYGLSGQVKKERIQRLSEAYALENHLHKTIKQYSGGLRQRLHLAISLVHDPGFLLMDEPTNALDAAGKKMLWQQIRYRSEQGRSTIIVSHDLHDVEKHCDYLLLFHQGKLTLNGQTGALIKQDNSYRLVYLVEGKLRPRQLEEKVMVIEGVRRMDITRDQITFSIDNNFGNAEVQIQEWLSTEGVQILESRKRKTDLSTLYFNLTGHTGGSNNNNKGRGKKKRRNR